MYHGMTHIEFTRAWGVYFSLLSECPQTTPLRHWESPLSGREIGGLSDFGVAAAMDEAENYSALVPMAG